MAKHIQRLFNVHAGTHAREIKKEISKTGQKRRTVNKWRKKGQKNTRNRTEKSDDIFSTQTKLQNNFFWPWT